MRQIFVQPNHFGQNRSRRYGYPPSASAIPAIALASDLEMQQAGDNGLPAMLK